jgi:hypothetical protein
MNGGEIMENILIKIGLHICRFLRLVDRNVALNASKVFTVAFIAGFMFSVACLDSDHWMMAVMCTAVCMLGGTFSMFCHAILESEGVDM